MKHRNVDGIEVRELNPSELTDEERKLMAKLHASYMQHMRRGKSVPGQPSDASLDTILISSRS